MVRNNWIETSMSTTNSTSAMLYQEGNYFCDAASTRSSTRSGIYIDDNDHICVSNLSIIDIGNGIGIIRNNYTNACTYTELPLRFECCTNGEGIVVEPIIVLQEEERRTIISENRENGENGENVCDPQLSEAMARHQENLSRLREEAERRQQEIIDKQVRREKERQLASEHARNLLLEFLDENNKQRLFDRQSLEILSRLFSDITYIVSTTEKNEMVKAINKQKGDVEVDRLCIVVNETDEDNQDNWLPIEDVVLSKVLYLLNAEEDFLRIARHHSRSDNRDNYENLYARLVPVRCE